MSLADTVGDTATAIRIVLVVMASTGVWLMVADLRYGRRVMGAEERRLRRSIVGLLLVAIIGVGSRVLIGFGVDERITAPLVLVTLPLLAASIGYVIAGARRRRS